MEASRPFVGEGTPYSILSNLFVQPFAHQRLCEHVPIDIHFVNLNGTGELPAQFFVTPLRQPYGADDLLWALDRVSSWLVGVFGHPSSRFSAARGQKGRSFFRKMLTVHVGS